MFYSSKQLKQYEQSLQNANTICNVCERGYMGTIPSFPLDETVGNRIDYFRFILTALSVIMIIFPFPSPPPTQIL